MRKTATISLALGTVLLMAGLGPAVARDGIKADKLDPKVVGEETGKTYNLPRGFVRLRSLAPGIIEDMRYATRENFTGAAVPGYRANTCILAQGVAQALARVQRSVAANGYALKVYDCYRPVRAVRAFVDWASREDGGNATKYFYPRIERHRIIPLGYIAERSSHSLGTAIDLTLVRLDRSGADTMAGRAQQSLSRDGEVAAGHVGAKPEGATCISPLSERQGRQGNHPSVDMGTAWDCFDVRSHTRHAAIPEISKSNRRKLLQAMTAEGFRNYAREWWHFSMAVDGYHKAHDFPVE